MVSACCLAIRTMVHGPQDNPVVMLNDVGSVGWLQLAEVATAGQLAVFGMAGLPVCLRADGAT